LEIFEHFLKNSCSNSEFLSQKLFEGHSIKELYERPHKLSKHKVDSIGNILVFSEIPKEMTLAFENVAACSE
jgi:hypothetical protein